MVCEGGGEAGRAYTGSPCSCFGQLNICPHCLLSVLPRPVPLSSDPFSSAGEESLTNHITPQKKKKHTHTLIEHSTTKNTVRKHLHKPRNTLGNSAYACIMGQNHMRELGTRPEQHTTKHKTTKHVYVMPQKNATGQYTVRP